MYSPVKLNGLFGARGKLVRGSLICAFALMYVAASPQAAAGLNPPPDGGYPNFNTAEGNNALNSVTSGAENTALGNSALNADTTGEDNTAVGNSALIQNVSGKDNTAVGAAALQDNTGDENTAVGYISLLGNTTGQENTAIGFGALELNGAGSDNTAVGGGALGSNKNGNDNTATGFEALGRNTSSDNTADGFQALTSNTNGADNTAAGFQTLQTNSSGSENTASGFQALVNNTAGNNNAGVGSGALAQNTTGDSNVAIGFDAGLDLTTGSNNIDIGANVLGKKGEANTIRIGKQGTQTSTIIAGISGTAVSGAQVVVSSTGKLGVAASSARFKEAIKPMDKASEAVLALKPVTFRYKEEIDPEKMPQFGLVAEEVEKVNPDLITRDESGKPVTVRYEAVNAMLLNEFLKEHRRADEQARKVEAQEGTIADLKASLKEQQKQMEALTAGLQEVRASVELHSPTARTAANN
jgi:Chaperone of endosialidase